MTAFALPRPFASPPGKFDLTPVARLLVGGVGTVMSALCVLAVARAVFGFAPELPHLRNVAVAFHVATVVPCLPLGLYLLMARKGTAMHKQLGKLWVALMVVTATSTIFIHEGMQLTWIHVFVPITYRSAWLIVRSARRGEIRAHKREIVTMYLGALTIPGIFAFALDGRLMNTMLLG